MEDLSQAEVKIALLTLNNKYKAIQNEIKNKLLEMEKIEKEYINLCKKYSIDSNNKM